MILGTVGAVLQGCLIPLQFVVFGELVDDFIDFSSCTNSGNNCTNIENEIKPFVYYYIGIAVGTTVTIALNMVMWGLTAERQVHTIRKAFFKSILRQDMAWFDLNDSGELNSRLSE